MKAMCEKLHLLASEMYIFNLRCRVHEDPQVVMLRAQDVQVDELGMEW